MGRIQSSIGLVTGIPVSDTIEQLLAISAQPRDLLVQRTARLQSQQVAVGELTAQVIGVDLAMRQLGNSSLFDRTQVTASNEAVLTATSTGNPSTGTHQFTPIQLAQSHQLLSSGFAGRDDPLGGGEFAISFGGFLDESQRLDGLNGGLGVQRGEIRITDRSGASSVIDLRLAQDVDDVLDAINAATEIDVTASTDGDHFVLTDNTGKTNSNLIVRQLGFATTAGDLGLGSIDVASDSAVGDDTFRLHEGFALSDLNDGTGVSLRRGVADLEVSFRDGSTPLSIDFLALSKGPTQSSATTGALLGLKAAVTITSVGVGATFDGYEVIFEDNEQVRVGQETVAVDSIRKTITFQIDEGRTAAADVVRALNDDAVASQLFTAAAVNGGGTGLVSSADTATTAGGAVAYNDERTIGAVLDTINAADPVRLQARISATGDAIELVDLTNGSETFSVSSAAGGSAAEGLGLAGAAASGGTIVSQRRISGLKTVLLDSLNGGVGFGQLGLVTLVDRTGATASVDLSGATTLDDVLTLLNSGGVGITARINRARNGIELVDQTVGGGALQVSSGDENNTADLLGITVNAEVDRVNSGSLHRQTFHEQIALSSLNRGQGASSGSFLITDSSGQSGAVNLQASQAETVGDVIGLINALSIGVEARINTEGDGLLLIDTAGGTAEMSVEDVSGTAASDLRIAGTSSAVNLGGTVEKAIVGSNGVRIELGQQDTLQDLVDKINDLEAGVSATLLNNGTGAAPYRLSLTSLVQGADGELLVDGSGLGADFEDVVSARDALLLVGGSDAAAAGAFAVSATNTFDDIIDGVSVTLLQSSLDPVTVNVSQTTEPVITQLNLFVGQYNSLQEKLGELTFYDEAENSTGVLFGSSEALRIEFDLANLVSGRLFGIGSIQSLEELGLSLDSDGRLGFDEQQFRDRYAESPDEVERFFTQAESGFAARFLNLADQLAGAENSLLINRTQALNATIEQNNDRILSLTSALNRERDSLIAEFAQLEAVISRLQANLNAISQIQPLAPPITG